MRSLAREGVFKYIFSRLFNPNDEGLFDVLIKDLNSDDKKFAKDLLDFIDAKYSEYQERIDNLAINYNSGRILTADKCAIMLGMAEMENYPETDTPVVVDEAVKIASKYSTEKSTDFVNGILAQFAKEIRS